MSVAVAGGVGAMPMPVIEASALMYEVPTMLPCPARAEGPNSSWGSTPGMRHMASASAGGTSSSTVPVISPTIPSTIPVISCSAGPAASTAFANGRACAFGTEMSTERPSMPDRAVLAFPDPMLASSRRASSWSSVYWVTGVLSGGEEVGGRLEGIAVDDQRDLAVRHDRRPGQRGALGDLRRERPLDQLALAEQGGDGDG